jgi:hypothetical protein
MRPGMSTSTRRGALPSVPLNAPVTATSGGFPVSRRHCGEDALALAKAEADCAVHGDCYINPACPVLGRVVEMRQLHHRHDID